MTRKVICMLGMLILITPALVFAGSHGKARPVKKGILLVAFGSSMPEARVSFENIDKRVKDTFKDVPVRWAYTSHIIRKKLAKSGTHTDSAAMALVRMMDEGFTHVAVQSLHTIRGEEYDDLVATVSAFQHMPEGIDYLIVGAPLMSSQEDMERITAALIENLPKNRKKDEAVVFMGHGTPHPANAFYAALMYHLQRKDPLIFVGTVEGSPAIDEIVGMLKENHIKKAYLMPFMSVAGDHARNDMAGDKDDSWKSILTQSGIVCEPVLKGTAEYANMIDIWVGHLETVMAHCKY